VQGSLHFGNRPGERHASATAVQSGRCAPRAASPSSTDRKQSALCQAARHRGTSTTSSGAPRCWAIRRRRERRTRQAEQDRPAIGEGGELGRQQAVGSLRSAKGTKTLWLPDSSSPWDCDGNLVGDVAVEMQAISDRVALPSRWPVGGLRKRAVRFLQSGPAGPAVSDSGHAFARHGGGPEPRIALEEVDEVTAPASGSRAAARHDPYGVAPRAGAAMAPRSSDAVDDLRNVRSALSSCRDRPSVS